MDSSSETDQVLEYKSTIDTKRSITEKNVRGAERGEENLVS
jgi:hypothetical protein